MRWFLSLLWRWFKAVCRRKIEAPVLEAERQADDAANPARPIKVQPPPNSNATDKERGKVTFKGLPFTPTKHLHGIGFTRITR